MDHQPDHANNRDAESDAEDDTLSRLVEHQEADKDNQPAPADGEKSADEETWPSGFGSFP
jgi:hypothetical protein